ncbi:MAG: phospho-N-acetylmuramoyl-pentapeptide-transferase [Actinobacteria bacterium]|nr:phospho-N-acetylmuramoyl-pentapeptide-transferase [Actinomycetota bacterium]
MISVLVAGAVAMVVAAFGTAILTGWLSRHGIGQQIRVDGPERHAVKAGTPTMGGLAIISAALIGYFAAHIDLGTAISRAGLLVLLVAVGSGVIGFVDDLLKVRRRRSLGLSKKAKFSGQILVALVFAILAIAWAHVNTHLSFAGIGGASEVGIQLGRVGWSVWAVVVIVGTSNALNLTDGLDGLAAGSATFAFACLAFIGYWEFRHYPIYNVAPSLDLALVALAFAGACAGFLWWNAAPARIFMGDTGSIALGAALAAICFEMNLQLLLPILGGLYVVETLSVIIQVISFRVFGRRIFRMAPLHHHFELAGWPETTVIVRFWILSGMATVAGLAAFYADFLSVKSIK